MEILRLNIFINLWFIQTSTKIPSKVFEFSLRANGKSKSKKNRKKIFFLDSTLTQETEMAIRQDKKGRQEEKTNH